MSLVKVVEGETWLAYLERWIGEACTRSLRREYEAANLIECVSSSATCIDAIKVEVLQSRFPDSSNADAPIKELSVDQISSLSILEGYDEKNKAFLYRAPTHVVTLSSR